MALAFFILGCFFIQVDLGDMVAWVIGQNIDVHQTASFFKKVAAILTDMAYTQFFPSGLVTLSQFVEGFEAGMVPHPGVFHINHNGVWVG